MELLDLVKEVREVKELGEDIKRQKREFNEKIKKQVNEHKSKKKEIEKYLKETINSLEYEYKEIEVVSFGALGKRNIKTYYPFLKIEDSFEVKELLFENYEESDDDGLFHEYILYNKKNGMEVKIKEHSVIKKYKKGTNQLWRDWFTYGEELINASGYISYEIEIEGMKFKFRRSYDVSKI